MPTLCDSRVGGGEDRRRWCAEAAKFERAKGHALRVAQFAPSGASSAACSISRPQTHGVGASNTVHSPWRGRIRGMATVTVRAGFSADELRRLAAASRHANQRMLEGVDRRRWGTSRGAW